jgi:3-isopropylmalate/(R)-2-methylmalate dehydratase small subunit
VLNQPAYRNTQILVTGPNFGCGSTREGAVYALRDYGIRALIAPSFGDIFRGNCVQNGVLPVVLPDDDVRRLCSELLARPGTTLTIDLAQQSVTFPGGTICRFDIEPSRKTQLLEGLDEIGITLKHRDEIAAFEAQYRARLPWLTPAQSRM